jgi:thiamine pyrophosphate-dependent acetolactate synthase large subunit-like protein
MDLHNPDFVKIAASFGIKAKRAKTLPQLKNIFLHHVAWEEPFLLAFSVPVFPPPWRTYRLLQRTPPLLHLDSLQALVII